jgi:adenylosuccinate synthase
VGLRICDLIDSARFEAKLTRLLSLKNQELQLLFQRAPLELSPLLEEYRGYAERLRPFVSAAEQRLAEGLRSLKKVLFEGAHGTLLDTNFGTYPFVTSSSTVASGVSCGAGIGPSRIDHTLGVVKAYTTRVGAGPLPSALSEKEQSLFADHKTAREIGTTTGRKRRMGWFDAPLVRHAVLLNGIDSLALTKLDILDPLEEIKICVGYRLRGEALSSVPPLVEDFEQVEPVYETMPGWRSSTRDVRSYKDLPKEAVRYVERLRELVGAPFSLISVGPERERTVILQQLLKE